MRFNIDHNGNLITVTSGHVSGRMIYRIEYQHGKRQPVMITQARHGDGGKFWTSIPEGRQKEAEFWGPLIERAIKNNF